ncbi:HXXEE domain-containing protein [Actinophytocola sp.]|uniref:HXXEE domain-containing protein n=1 Tax=Actinophytocola sp. TaxID=1872138 RepID=UPI003D6AD9A9
MAAQLELGKAATWGLFAAWVIHDAEELATMPAWVRRVRRHLDGRLPTAVTRRPDDLGRGEHVAVAMGLMACLMATAAARGARTDGRSRMYQAVLYGFGAHSVPHVLSAALTRTYTPGLVTAVTVVAPFWWWSSRRLREAGVPPAPLPAAALPLVPASIAAAHLGAGSLLRLRDRLRRR